MRVSLGNLKVGMTIYFVHAFSDPDKIKWCAIDELTTIHFPIKKSNLSDFIRVSHSKHIGVDLVTNTWTQSPSSAARNQDQSMEDMGIIPNKYNKHQTFSTLSEAKQHICNIIGINIADSGGSPTSNYDRAMKILDLD